MNNWKQLGKVFAVGEKLLGTVFAVENYCCIDIYEGSDYAYFLPMATEVHFSLMNSPGSRLASDEYRSAIVYICACGLALLVLLWQPFTCGHAWLGVTCHDTLCQYGGVFQSIDVRVKISRLVLTSCHRAEHLALPWFSTSMHHMDSYRQTIIHSIFPYSNSHWPKGS